MTATRSSVLPLPSDALARQRGLSTRTLERLFHADRGGIRDRCGAQAGYSSVSAYIAAFKQTFGCTPGAIRGDSA